MNTVSFIRKLSYIFAAGTFFIEMMLVFANLDSLYDSPPGAGLFELTLTNNLFNFFIGALLVYYFIYNFTLIELLPLFPSDSEEFRKFYHLNMLTMALLLVYYALITPSLNWHSLQLSFTNFSWLILPSFIFVFLSGVFTLIFSINFLVSEEKKLRIQSLRSYILISPVFIGSVSLLLLGVSIIFIILFGNLGVFLLVIKAVLFVAVVATLPGFFDKVQNTLSIRSSSSYHPDTDYFSNPEL